MLVLPHAVTSGALLYIEQEKLISGKPEPMQSFQTNLYKIFDDRMPLSMNSFL